MANTRNQMALAGPGTRRWPSSSRYSDFLASGCRMDRGSINPTSLMLETICLYLASAGDVFGRAHDEGVFITYVHHQLKNTFF